MERRKFIKGALLTASSASLVACASTTSGTENVSGDIIHSVYFWLNDGTTPEEEKDFLNFFEALRKVPGIKTLNYGKPAAVNPRPVVDNSFSYNLIVTFANMENLDIYETHPIHLEAIDKYKKYWNNVQVRDTQL